MALPAFAKLVFASIGQVAVYPSTHLVNGENVREQRGEMGVSGRGIRRLTKDADATISHERGPAWDEYLRIPAEVEPNVIQSLLALELHDNDIQFWQEDEKRLREWCGRWGFLYQFAEIPARSTWAAARRRKAGNLHIPTGFKSTWAGWPYPEWDEPNVPRPPTEIRSYVLGGAGGESQAPFDMPGRRYDPPDETGKVWIGRGYQVLLPDYFWNPVRESRSCAQARIVDHVKKAIIQNLVAIESAYGEHGYRPMREPRELNGFEWLARIQTRRELIPSIAREVDVDEAFVRARVNDAQQLLGIKRQSAVVGRPRSKRPTVIRNPRGRSTN
jgi:hypothetical protein